MAKNSRGKRPCCICRKWFQPDVRQKGRQKTCTAPDCMNEQHRRQCKKWNKKNKDQVKSNYLGEKIEAVESKQDKQCKKHQVSMEQLAPLRKTKPVLPWEIIAGEFGIKSAIIIQYLTYQIMNQANGRAAGFS